MINSEKFNRVTTQVQTRQGISHAFRIGFAALALPLIINA